MNTMMKSSGRSKSHFVPPLALLQLLLVALFVFAAGTGGTYNLSLTNTATGVAIPIVSTTNGDYVTNYAVISLPESVTFTVAPPVNNNNFTVGFWDFNGAGNPSHISGNNTTVMSYFASTNTPIAITPVTLYSSRTDDASVLCTTAQQVLQLIPFKLMNLADPYQGAYDTSSSGAVIFQNPGHNDQDTQIDLSPTTNSTDINSVAWIAAGDASTGNAPRMPELVATLGAPSGTTVWWKLSVINHSQVNPTQPYRDFDTGASLTSAEIAELTNVNEWAGYSGPVGGMIGYSDNIAIPFPESSQDSGVQNGWVPIPGGTPWNIYQDPDWLTAVAAGFFGGDAELSFKITTSDGNTTILPEQDFYFRIAGENPSPTVCENYIDQQYNGGQPSSSPQRWTGLSYTSGKTPPTVPGYWFAYAMAKEETDGDGGRMYYNNFMDNGGQLAHKGQPWPGHEGRPDWNNDGASADGTGGYGLFQLTFDSSDPTFIMPRDWIWNWQTNVKELLPIVQQKLRYTQGYLNYLHANNASFTDPSSLTTNADVTTFNFWESSVITLNNTASIILTTPSGAKRAGAWSFTPGTGGAGGTWNYVPNGNPGYLYNVAVKGVENHP